MPAKRAKGPLAKLVAPPSRRPAGRRLAALSVRGDGMTGSKAKRRRASDLIECGPEATEREKLAFFDRAARLMQTSDRAEQKRLKEELARMIFGGRRRDGA
jgi:hypothetical protein